MNSYERKKREKKLNTFYNISPQGGTLFITEGQKVTPNGKNGQKKSEIGLKSGAKWKKKMGGRNHVITFVVFHVNNGILYYSVCSFCYTMCIVYDALVV